MQRPMPGDHEDDAVVPAALVFRLVAKLEDAMHMIMAEQNRGSGVLSLLQGMRNLVGKALSRTDSRMDQIEAALARIQTEAEASKAENARLRARMADNERRTASLEHELRQQHVLLAPPEPPLNPKMPASNPNSPGSPRNGGRNRRRYI